MDNEKDLFEFKFTCWDCIKFLSPDEFCKVYWKILDYSKFYTDSRVWLKTFLNDDPNKKENMIILRSLGVFKDEIS